MQKNNHTDIELLSPAGGFESLMAAIQGGADAVYFGVGDLNMRSASSKNFRTTDLPEISKICRDHGMKSYVTLNTVMYDEDLEKVKSTLEAIKENNIDAVIASDFAVIQYAREAGVPIHISTQSNISNIESVRFFSKLADVMVLARELSLEQVQKICRTVKKEQIKGPSGKPVRIEAFAHGALCMAISGKCYLSLHEKNKSANRGECLQLCRRAYTVSEKEDQYQLDIDNEYIMSPKDLSTITFINRLLDAGVEIFKIEGRGRPPEYVKTTTKYYRKALDAWKKDEFTEEKAKEWEEELKTVFNRGFWEGYYMGKRSGEWSSIYGSNATRRKIYLGKGMNYFSNIGVAEFLIETKDLTLGDQVIITGPTTGVIETTVDEIRVDLKPVDKAIKGQRCSIPVPAQVRRSDKLYKIVQREISENTLY